MNPQRSSEQATLSLLLLLLHRRHCRHNCRCAPAGGWDKRTKRLLKLKEVPWEISNSRNPGEDRVSLASSAQCIDADRPCVQHAHTPCRAVIPCVRRQPG